MPLKQFFEAMEDAGEIVTLMSHTKTDDGFQCAAKSVFLLDDLVGPTNKKRKVNKALIAQQGTTAFCMSDNECSVTLTWSLCVPAVARFGP